MTSTSSCSSSSTQYGQGNFCDACLRPLNTVSGMRFRCLICTDFDLCADCNTFDSKVANHAHDNTTHPMVQLRSAEHVRVLYDHKHRIQTISQCVQTLLGKSEGRSENPTTDLIKPSISSVAIVTTAATATTATSASTIPPASTYTYAVTDFQPPSTSFLGFQTSTSVAPPSMSGTLLNLPVEHNWVPSSSSTPLSRTHVNPFAYSVFASNGWQPQPQPFGDKYTSSTVSASSSSSSSNCTELPNAAFPKWPTRTTDTTVPSFNFPGSSQFGSTVQGKQSSFPGGGFF